MKHLVIATPRLRTLVRWHTQIRELDQEGTAPRVMAEILHAAGCKESENSIRRYAKRRRERGRRTAEELGIQLVQLPADPTPTNGRLSIPLGKLFAKKLKSLAELS